MHIGLNIKPQRGRALIEVGGPELEHMLVFGLVVAGHPEEPLFTLDGEPFGLDTNGTFVPHTPEHCREKQLLTRMLAQSVSGWDIDEQAFRVMESKSEVPAISLHVTDWKLADFLRRLGKVKN
jgi:hypothetical protein